MRGQTYFSRENERMEELVSSGLERRDRVNMAIPQ